MHAKGYFEAPSREPLASSSTAVSVAAALVPTSAMMGALIAARLDAEAAEVVVITIAAALVAFYGVQGVLRRSWHTRLAASHDFEPALPDGPLVRVPRRGVAGFVEEDAS